MLAHNDISQLGLVPSLHRVFFLFILPSSIFIQILFLLPPLHTQIMRKLTLLTF
jgi:hypothetical protein